MSDGGFAKEEIDAALQHVLAWPEIARSGQLAKFLSYIVERKLRGDAQSIKAYSIAVDVFGRPANFDPQADPIVRVQARRLRALLSQFYREEGAEDAVRITLPTGRYVPEFVRRAEETTPTELSDQPIYPTRWGGLSVSWYMLAALTLGLAVLAIGLSSLGARQEAEMRNAGLVVPPTVLVAEFQSLSGEITDLGMAAGLPIALVNDLNQFEMISAEYGGSSGAVSSDGHDYVLSGIARREADALQYSAILTETESGDVVWNQTIALTGNDARREDVLGYVADRLSMILGNPRGPLHRRARDLLEAQPALADAGSLYLCRVLFDLYREAATTEAGRRALTCLEGLGAEQAVDGAALAAMASLTAEDVGEPALDQDERLAQASALLAQAAEASPISAFVWEQRARVLEVTGQDALAEAAYSTASQINPANSDVIAARARHLAFIGRLDIAVRLMTPVMQDSPAPPPWYFCVPTLEAIRLGDYALAIDNAAIYAEVDKELGPILAVMAGQGLGDRTIVNAYLPRVLDQASFRAAGILTQLRQRISDETLLRDIRVALLSAGVPAGALNAPF